MKTEAALLASVTLERDMHLEAACKWEKLATERYHEHRTAAAERDQLRAKLAEYDGLLCECEDYFDNRADADMDQDGNIPNEEMKMLTAIRARSHMGGENE